MARMQPTQHSGRRGSKAYAMSQDTFHWPRGPIRLTTLSSGAISISKALHSAGVSALRTLLEAQSALSKSVRACE